MPSARALLEYSDESFSQLIERIQDLESVVEDLTEERDDLIEEVATLKDTIQEFNGG